MTWSKGQRVPGALDCVRRPSWDFHVEWLELHKEVTTYYGIPWRMTDWEAGQNSYRTYDVSPESADGRSREECERIMDRWQSAVCPDGLNTWLAESWWAVREPNADVILWSLCAIGAIPPGRYLITKWW